MPLSAYFHGNGSEVAAAMKKTYGDTKKAQAVFYATANETGQTPGASSRSKSPKPKATSPSRSPGGAARQRKPSMRKRGTKTA